MHLKLTYANVVATLALFIALGGSSYAAVELGKNSVKSENIGKEQVRASDIAKNAVSSAKVKDASRSSPRTSSPGSYRRARLARSARVVRKA